jgi:hypothetical protein
MLRLSYLALDLTQEFNTSTHPMIRNIAKMKQAIA